MLTLMLFSRIVCMSITHRHMHMHSMSIYCPGSRTYCLLWGRSTISVPWSWRLAIGRSRWRNPHTPRQLLPLIRVCLSLPGCYLDFAIFGYLPEVTAGYPSRTSVEVISVYLDDILVAPRTLEEHLAHLVEVFNRLRKAGLCLKPKKCAFLHDEFVYLGNIISLKGIRPDPAKVH